MWCTSRLNVGVSKLIERGEIEVAYRGNNRPGNPRHSVITSLIFQPKFSDMPDTQYKKTKDTHYRGKGFTLGDREKENVKRSVIQEWEGKIIKIGERNSTAFRLTREFRRRYGGKIGEKYATAVLETLKKSFIFEDFGRSFTERELL